MSWMKQNKKRNQTLENAQYGLKSHLKCWNWTELKYIPVSLNTTLGGLTNTRDSLYMATLFAREALWLAYSGIGLA